MKPSLILPNSRLIFKGLYLWGVLILIGRFWLLVNELLYNYVKIT